MLHNFHPDGQVKYSSGLDCSGFLWRALSYEGHPYAVTDRLGTTDFGNARYSRTIVEPGATSTLNIEGLDELVPGDILLWPDSHVCIVLDVDVDPLG